MSYCRKADDSDVYVLSTVYGFECVSCKLKPKYTMYDSHPSTVCKDQTHMLKHLERHILAGHKVPLRATKRLQTEVENKQSRLKNKQDKTVVPNPNKAFKK